MNIKTGIHHQRGQSSNIGQTKTPQKIQSNHWLQTSSHSSEACKNIQQRYSTQSVRCPHITSRSSSPTRPLCSQRHHEHTPRRQQQRPRKRNKSSAPAHPSACNAKRGCPRKTATSTRSICRNSSSASRYSRWQDCQSWRCTRGSRC